MNDKAAQTVIVGAGPAGLAAARELLLAGRPVVVIEKHRHIGGLARTVVREGCRFDIGPHRFFSKSEEINRLWRDELGDDFIRVERLTRILYHGRYFHYPLKVFSTLRGLGAWGSLRALGSYFFRPRRVGVSYEDYIRSAFGNVLYETFFKSYSEKIWGIPCGRISPDFASQRIHGLSFWSAFRNALVAERRGLPSRVKSLVSSFHYPRLGSGSFYEGLAAGIKKSGGEILTGWRVESWNLSPENGRLASVTASRNGEKRTFEGRYFISTVPINELAFSFSPRCPNTVMEAARALRFRHHVSVNLTIRARRLFPDQWIYIHDPGLAAARVANYRNFSREMSEQEDIFPVTLEYFCSQDEPLWLEADDRLVETAIRELRHGIIGRDCEVTGAFVIREADAYPVYFLHYQPFLRTIREYLAGIANLQVAGRSGLYRYNNMDHSLLTGIFAARNILGQRFDVWSVNADAEYLEQVREQDSY